MEEQQRLRRLTGVSAGSAASQGRFATSAAERLQILALARTIAIVGLSANPFRPSHFAAIYLLAEGYHIIPVNPGARAILGQPAVGSLREINEPVDIVDIFREPAAVPTIVEEAIAIGARVIWMQLGVINETAAERARQAGLAVVMDSCVKIEHARFFGGLNTLGLNTGVVTSRRLSRRSLGRPD